jgi:hypothetical protein
MESLLKENNFNQNLNKISHLIICISILTTSAILLPKPSIMYIENVFGWFFNLLFISFIPYLILWALISNFSKKTIEILTIIISIALINISVLVMYQLGIFFPVFNQAFMGLVFAIIILSFPLVILIFMILHMIVYCSHSIELQWAGLTTTIYTSVCFFDSAFTNFFIAKGEGFATAFTPIFIIFGIPFVWGATVLLHMLFEKIKLSIQKKDSPPANIEKS